MKKGWLNTTSRNAGNTGTQNRDAQRNLQEPQRKMRSEVRKDVGRPKDCEAHTEIRNKNRKVHSTECTRIRGQKNSRERSIWVLPIEHFGHVGCKPAIDGCICQLLQGPSCWTHEREGEEQMARISRKCKVDVWRYERWPSIL